jgi:dimethylhistidine N-methyltransferase
MLNFAPSAQTFLLDVVEGLGQTPKMLPSKYFYDDRGSRLFDEICRLEEYYLTAAELNIMQYSAKEMAETLRFGTMLIEYGSGSSLKTRLLLNAIRQPATYVPVDISGNHLQRSTAALRNAYPHIEILPVCADFTEVFELPRSHRKPNRRVVYFPGSTIGNFSLADARALLTKIARLCGPGGGLLIGIDLKKAAATIEAAYNDRSGLTKAFNKNLLYRINRELAADFQVDAFEHCAFYNAELGRIEMHLVSSQRQVVTIDGGAPFRFYEGETICTEYSYKYSIDDFQAIAGPAGFALEQAWTDEREMFAVLHFHLPAV